MAIHVKELPNTQPTDVYDLELDDGGSHTFYANDILVHNTDSIFVKYHEALKSIYKDDYDNVSDSDKIDMVLKLNEGCANYVNDVIMPKILMGHNTSPTEGIATKYNFNLKQELVMRRTIFFPKKKKYAIYIVRENGTPVEKINNPGMEIVRSDYPQFTRTMMKEVVDTILKKGANTGDIISLVNRYNREYSELLAEGDTRAAIPSSWNRENYAAGRYPRGVKSMLVYNAIYGNVFRVMDRGYRFDIRNISIDRFSPEIQERLLDLKESGKMGKEGKLDCISVPSGSRLDTTMFEVDEDSMVQYAVRDRLDDICTLYGIQVNDLDAVID